MKKNRLSLILTVFNEQNSIGRLINSIAEQSKIPDEIIIVDGGSTDNTLEIIQNSKFSPRFGEAVKIQNHKSKLKVFKKIGNRSVGRNNAIKKATGDIILCTDSGCVLDRKWVENISRPFENKTTKIVAGYYKGISKNIFQKCLIPYVLVMDDKIKGEFLPSTRSMAFKKSVWQTIGGFDETLSHNEDYVFAIKIKKYKFKIIFEKKAIANWIPRDNFNDTFIMFFRFAFGDAEAKIFRPKVFFVFLRYLMIFCLILSAFIINSNILYDLSFLLILIYISWSIFKNYKYVKNYLAFLYLPIIQFLSDFAVLSGTTLGFFKSLTISKT